MSIMIVRQLMVFIVVMSFRSYATYVGWSKSTCSNSKIVLTSTYTDSDKRLEIEMGFDTRPRLIIIENGSVVIRPQWIDLDELDIELNFTTRQVELLQKLHMFYPDSLRVSISYSCRIDDFRCSVNCDIGHRLVRMREHSFSYDRGINRSVAEMCVDGHNMDALNNSSDIVKNRWFDFCNEIVLVRNETDTNARIIDVEEPSAILESSVGRSVAIVFTIVFVVLLVVFVSWKKINVQTVSNLIYRTFGLSI